MYTGWPPNLGGRRDIPSTALFHHSVIDRMRLPPDPKNYRPKFYMPNNSLWVQTGNNQLENGTSNSTTRHDAAGNSEEERDLRELAEQFNPKDGAHRKSETQPLVKSPICFVHDDKLTKGSVPFEGEDAVFGAEKSDRIYRVALKSN